MYQNGIQLKYLVLCAHLLSILLLHIFMQKLWWNLNPVLYRYSDWNMSMVQCSVKLVKTDFKCMLTIKHLDSPMAMSEVSGRHVLKFHAGVRV